MPIADLGQVRVHYEMAGEPQAPALVLSNSLGTDLSMWEPQVAEFSRFFHLLRYDMRGHGGSSTPLGLYTIEECGMDVLRLLDALGIERVLFCGLSVGGMIGQWLGVHAPQRLVKLVLANTAARIGSAEMWNARIEAVRADGMSAVAAAAVERWFTPEFRGRTSDRNSSVVERTRSMVEAANPDGYTATCAAIRDMDLRDSVQGIRVPTLVIGGDRDPVTTPAEGRWLANAIPRATYLELAAAHLSNLEAPAEFTAAVLQFLTNERQEERPNG
jgi:3-oxoadipate enol-lactonase